MKHTQGPWKSSAGMILANGGAVATIPSGAGCVRSAAKSEDETAANCRLIATAPELLEIVERLFYSINGLSATFAATNRDFACSTLRKEIAEAIRLSQIAITKAKGEL